MHSTYYLFRDEKMMVRKLVLIKMTGIRERTNVPTTANSDLLKRKTRKNMRARETMMFSTSQSNIRLTIASRATHWMRIRPVRRVMMTGMRRVAFRVLVCQVATGMD